MLFTFGIREVTVPSAVAQKSEESLADQTAEHFMPLGENTRICCVVVNLESQCSRKILDSERHHTGAGKEEKKQIAGFREYDELAFTRCDSGV